MLASSSVRLLKKSHLQMKASPKKNFCSDHCDKQLEAFCSTCRTLLCVDCLIQTDAHRGHDISSIDKAKELE